LSGCDLPSRPCTFATGSCRSSFLQFYFWKI